MIKKILFLGRFTPPFHGAALMNEHYFNSLNNDKNFQVEKIKLNKYDSLEEIGGKSLKKLRGYFQTYTELIKKLRKFKPEIIYLEMAPRGIAFYKDSIYVLISKIFKKRVVIHFHAKGARETTKKKLAKKYYKFIFKNTKIILLSNLLFKDISNVAKKSQVSIVPNGIPDEITDKEFKKIIEKRKKNKKLQLLFLSNMIESKGPLDVLKICNELNKTKIDFECNFVGKFQDSEFKKRFEKQLKDFNLEKKCKYLGAKYGDDKKKILEKTNVLVFPTRYENECFPLVILEAFMYGIPVLSYDAGAIKEIISEDYLGVASGSGWEILAKRIKEKTINKINSKEIRGEFKKRYLSSKTRKRLKELLK